MEYLADGKEIVFVDYKISGERTGKRAMRKAEAEKQEHIKPDSGMALAELNIRRGYHYVAGFLNPKSVNLEGVGGSSGISDEEAARRQKYINRMQEWSTECAKMDRLTYAVCLDVFCFEFSYRESAGQRGISPATVMRRLQKGLELYCDLNGLRY